MKKIHIKFLEAYEDGVVELEIDGHPVAGKVGKEYDIDFSRDPFDQEDVDDNELQEALGK